MWLLVMMTHAINDVVRPTGMRSRRRLAIALLIMIAVLYLAVVITSLMQPESAQPRVR